MTLKLPEFESEPFSILTDIPQGSSLSLILYLFYNADLLNINNRSDLQAVTASWIDDVGFTVSGVSTEANCQVLQTLHVEAETWAHRHALVFALSKYELIHFINKLDNHNTSTALTLGSQEVSPTRIC